MKRNFNPVPSVTPFLLGESFIELIVGPVGCLAGDSLVVTEYGAIPISDINRPMRVLSWNEKTCQFQLSWCGGSFPKGRDYLYRVVTQQGEFDAAARHLLLCDDGEYRHVETLFHQQHALKTCSRNQLSTIQELCQIESHEDALRSTKIDVGYLGDCAALDRLRGQPFLQEGGTDRAFVPSHSDVQKYNQLFARVVSSQLNTPQVALSSHSQPLIYGDHPQTGGSYRPDALHHVDAEGRTAAGFYEHAVGLFRQGLQSLRKFGHRLKAKLYGKSIHGLVSAFSSPEQKSTPNGAIIYIKKLDKQVPYWDIQVAETHNYVTVDGAIHHNSTKTTAGIMKVAYQAKRMAPCEDGIRRSRCIWIRNTREQLRDTSIPDFLKWYPDGQAGTYMKSEYKFILKFDDVECEVLFRGLDDANDVRRVLSLQASFAVMDEFREINQDIFEAVQARLGRYPDSSMVLPREEWGVDEKGNPIGGCVTDDGQSNKHIWGMTNPPDMDTFWEKYLSDPPRTATVHFQPSGMSQEADWIKYLPSNYYEDMADGKSQDYIDVYIHAKFGKSLSGMPVFRSFDRDLHVAKAELRPINMSSNPLLIGIDFGLTPACVIGQIDPSGRLNLLADLTSEGMGILRFCQEKLKPLIAQRFPGMNVLCIGDPAGNQRAPTDEKTVFDVLKSQGFRVIPAKTNSPVARINAVDTWLTRMSDGKPAFLIDSRCDATIQALRGGYRYKIKTNGEMVDSPDKNRHSHIADALQYLCLHADNNATGAQIQTRAREVLPSTYMYS